MPVAPSLFNLPLKRISGDETSLTHFEGKVLLIVNVASKCGLTPQYEGLETLYARYKDRGFEILAFPANDFAGQEPGTDADIHAFCTTSFAVTFPLFSKITVTGPETHPLYTQLIEAQPTAQQNEPGFRAQLDGYLSKHGAATNPDPGVLWNFEKFLVNRSGQVIARFAPDMPPEDPRITAAIEAAL